MQDNQLEELLTEQIRSAIDCYASTMGWKKHRKDARIAYASSPITSGPRMYQLMERLGVTSRDRIPQNVFQTEVVIPNIDAGEEFAQQIRDTKQYATVISPATFFAKRWKQEHYMTLWRVVIENFPTAVHYSNSTSEWTQLPAWAYSDGCAEEYDIGLASGKQLFEGVELTELPRTKALADIKAALGHIEKLGVDNSKLMNIHRILDVKNYTQKKEGVRV